MREADFSATKATGGSDRDQARNRRRRSRGRAHNSAGADDGFVGGQFFTSLDDVCDLDGLAPPTTLPPMSGGGVWSALAHDHEFVTSSSAGRFGDYDHAGGPTTSGEAKADELTTVANTNPIGIYGWRKKCVYLTLLVLAVLVLVNMGLLVYIMYTLSINKEGAGPLRFQSSRVHANGRVEFAEGLLTDRIATFQRAELKVQSGGRMSLTANENEPAESTVLTLDEHGIRAEAQRVVMAYNGQPYFTADPDSLRVDSVETVFGSTAGLLVKGAIQTNHISNAYTTGKVDTLTLEAVAQAVGIKAGGNVSIISTDGSMHMEALQGITLRATGANAAVVLSGTQIRLPSLVADITDATQSLSFTLCVCGSGLLYRVDANLLCSSATAACG